MTEEVKPKPEEIKPEQSKEIETAKEPESLTEKVRQYLTKKLEEGYDLTKIKAEDAEMWAKALGCSKPLIYNVKKQILSAKPKEPDTAEKLTLEELQAKPKPKIAPQPQSQREISPPSQMIQLTQADIEALTDALIGILKKQEPTEKEFACLSRQLNNLNPHLPTWLMPTLALAAVATHIALYTLSKLKKEEKKEEAKKEEKTEAKEEKKESQSSGWVGIIGTESSS